MTKISELTPAAALAGTESVPITQAGQTVRTSVAALAASAVASDATLAALAAQNWAANAVPVGTGADTMAQLVFAPGTFLARASTGDIAAKPITDFALTLLDDADAATARATLGAGTVTSINITGTTGITPSGGPITGSGSITLTLDTGLQSLASFNTSAFVVQQSTNVFVGRTITGTANRISVSNGSGASADPVINIDPAYVGQATITTLGTITTGTWTGTDIAVADGGTGASTAAAARTNLGFADGTYTPTGTVGANCTITTVRDAQYLRVGNTVHVTGIADITVTAASTLTHFELSLPVASNLANIWELAGAGSNTESAAYTAIRIIGNTTNDRAVLTFYPTSTGLRSIGYSYSYKVI